MKKFARVCGIALIVGLMFPRDAWAYLDPGSGSLFFQTIAAVAAGAAYGVRLYWSRVAAWFRRDSARSSQSSSEPQNPASR